MLSSGRILLPLVVLLCALHQGRLLDCANSAPRCSTRCWNCCSCWRLASACAASCWAMYSRALSASALSCKNSCCRSGVSIRKFFALARRQGFVGVLKMLRDGSGFIRRWRVGLRKILLRVLRSLNLPIRVQQFRLESEVIPETTYARWFHQDSTATAGSVLSILISPSVPGESLTKRSINGSAVSSACPVSGFSMVERAASRVRPVAGVAQIRRLAQCEQWRL